MHEGGIDEPVVEPILIVDDENTIRDLLRRFLEKDGYRVDDAATGEEAISMISSKYYPVIITDLKMPGLSGQDLLERVGTMHKKAEVIMLTGHGSIDLAVEAIRNGAFDFLTKPIDFERLLVTLRNALNKTNLQHQIQTLKTHVQKELNLKNIIGTNLEMLKIFDTIRRVSDNDVNILITGESGTGKELIARAIHVNSSRNSGPFVPVNCMSLAETLLESELFGHERGAFTGAVGRKEGYFKAANNGTVFLDEIGDLSLHFQAKLLRTVQERIIQRVGSTEITPIDVRIISATNKCLEGLLKEGRFREDLYYRLNVLSIELPPLRERKDDLPQLSKFFLQKFTGKFSKSVEGFSNDAEEILMGYNWPGNIRELENVIQRAVSLADTSYIQIEHLPPQIVNEARGGTLNRCFLAISSLKEAKQATMEKFEKEYLSEALRRNHGSVTNAAEKIGIGRTALQRLLAKHNISSRDFKPRAQAT